MKLSVFFLYIARALLNGFYALLKCFPTKDQVCFFSRQSDSVTPDFARLTERLREQRPELGIKMICCRFADAGDGVLRFAWALLRSMAILARSRVCVLDGYWPAVCLLKHKPSLKVIQIWHSNGKIKQSGYQTLGRDGGRDPAVAKAVRMHRGYDYIIAGGTAWNPYYMASFGVDESKLLNYGLPRMDLLTQDTERGERLRERHPELTDKIIVLYAPTFRGERISPPTELISLFSDPRYALICRFHPRQKFIGDAAPNDPYAEENTFDLLCACDWFITDYSSLALEAAALEKRTLYYLFDHEDYIRENGVNLDLFSVMPRCCFRQAAELFGCIASEDYPWEELARYRADYLPEQLGRATENICNVIEDCLDGREIRDNGRREYASVGAGADPT